MKRFCRIFIFVICFFVLTFNVSAATIKKEWMNVYSTKVLTDRKFWAQMSFLTRDNSAVYCIEPGVGVNEHNYNETISFKDYGISDADKEYLELISYYGYNYPDHQTTNYYLATQELVWRAIGVIDVEYRTKSNYEGEIINIEEEKKFILDSIKKHYIKPSFDNKQIEGIVGDEIEVLDENNVINNYEVIEGDAYIKNNKLYINLTDLGTSVIKLKKKKYKEGKSYLYYNDNSQNLIELNLESDVYSEISVNVVSPKGIIEINKTGEVYGKQEIKNKPLSGVKYGIYSSLDDSLIDTIVTNESGIARSGELELGEYCIKELAVDKNYELDSNKYCFNFDNASRKNNIMYKKYEFNNKLILGKLNFKKMGEVYKEIKDNKFIYEYTPLESIPFALFAGEDIYNTSNQLIYNKNKLINVFETDENGNVTIDNLPVGKYYIKEINSDDIYEENNDIYYFEVSPDNYKNVNINNNNIIYNKLKKGKLEILKVDSDTEKPLKNVEFTLLDENKNKLLSLKTNELGIVKFDNLLLNKYYLVESENLKGYIKDNNIYEINSNIDNNIKLKISNKKTIMPNTGSYFNYRYLISYLFAITGGIIYVVSKKKYC